MKSGLIINAVACGIHVGMFLVGLTHGTDWWAMGAGAVAAAVHGYGVTVYAQRLTEVSGEDLSG